MKRGVSLLGEEFSEAFVGVVHVRGHDVAAYDHDQLLDLLLPRMRAVVLEDDGVVGGRTDEPLGEDAEARALQMAAEHVGQVLVRTYGPPRGEPVVVSATDAPDDEEGVENVVIGGRNYVVL